MSSVSAETANAKLTVYSAIRNEIRDLLALEFSLVSNANTALRQHKRKTSAPVRTWISPHTVLTVMRFRIFFNFPCFITASSIFSYAAMVLTRCASTHCSILFLNRESSWRCHSFYARPLVLHYNYLCNINWFLSSTFYCISSRNDSSCHFSGADFFCLVTCQHQTNTEQRAKNLHRWRTNSRVIEAITSDRKSYALGARVVWKFGDVNRCADVFRSTRRLESDLNSEH